MSCAQCLFSEYDHIIFHATLLFEKGEEIHNYNKTGPSPDTGGCVLSILETVTPMENV